MPIDASIPLQGKQPDMLGSISSMLGIQKQAAELKQVQQTTRQRANLASFDVQKIIGDDGTIDLNKVPGSGLREAAGDQFPEVLQHYLTVKQSQLTAKEHFVQLTDKQRASFGDIMGALRSDPDVAGDTPEGRAKVSQAFAQYSDMYGKDVENVLRAYAPPIAHAPHGKLAQVLQNIQLQATSADSQASRQAPSYTNTGSELQNINPYAQPGQVRQSMPLGIGPGEQSTVLTDQLGNQFEMRRDAKGNILGTRPLSGGTGGPATFGPGERGALEHQADQNFANVNANRIAATLAPQQLDQINKALSISKEVNTGGGDLANRRAKWESAIASIVPGISSAANDATKLQLLDKFAERIAADSARVLGANASTDAARESIHRQNANTGYTSEAVQEVLKYAKAQTLAMQAKGDAQEKWLDQKGNGITKQHQFETQWRQSYDPVIFQLEAAEPEDRKKIIQGLSKTEAASLKAKRDALRLLGAIQ